MIVDHQTIGAFRQTVWQYGQKYYRDFIWRNNTSPYLVFLSEIMLQQTQTGRVQRLLPAFLDRFPDFKTLATATTADVLTQWIGLGYNRRAKYLHQSAQAIWHDFSGRLPNQPDILSTLPGIGPNTAGSMAAYAYNQATVFVETNIRTVFIHHFWPDATEPIGEKAIRNLVAETLVTDLPRLWYWALMDYGVHLKKTVGNLNRQAKAYTKQSTFTGSLRQARGAILKILCDSQPKLTGADLAAKLATVDPQRYQKALDSLVTDGLLVAENDQFFLPR